MAKKTKNKPKFSWKIALSVIAGIVIFSAVTVQLLFNIFVWQELQRHAAFDMRQLIIDAVDGLNEQKTALGSDGKISEAKLKLPTDLPEAEGMKIIYMHNSAMDYSPETIQFTTRSLTAEGKGALWGGNVEGVLRGVEELQACVRGISLDINSNPENQSSGSFVAEKTLQDGRKVSIFRETACTSTQMDDLEKIISQVQSY